MKIRIHFSVGSTAMYLDFDPLGTSFVEFMDKVYALRKKDEILRISTQDKSCAIAAQSIVFVEEVLP